MCCYHRDHGLKGKCRQIFFAIFINSIVCRRGLALLSDIREKVHYESCRGNPICGQIYEICILNIAYKVPQSSPLYEILAGLWGPHRSQAEEMYQIPPTTFILSLLWHIYRTKCMHVDDVLFFYKMLSILKCCVTKKRDPVSTI